MKPSDTDSMSDDEAISSAALLGAEQIDWWALSGDLEPAGVRFSCYDDWDGCSWEESSAPTRGAAARKYIVRRLERIIKWEEETGAAFSITGCFALSPGRSQ